ncbi:MAG: hypothetical protein IE926_16690, partial [Micrococcales bacterium]|nr:hypothetical protein [Micrococcales bacterium]
PRTARRVVRGVPRSPAQARTTAERVLDRRIVPDDGRREALLRTFEARARLVTPAARDQAALTRQALGLGRRLARLGRPEAAIRVYTAGEAALRRPDQRLLLTVQRAALELRRGVVPDDLWDRLRDLLDLADRTLAAGDPDTAGARLQEAYNLAFHRTHHFEDRMSPLAADPDAFLAPFRASSAARTAETPTGRTRPTAAPVAGRPHRLLVTTFMNWNFVGDIVEDYRATPGVEVRTLDLQQIPDGPWRAQPVDLVKDRLRQATGGPDLDPPAEVREAFDWADTVFVEWAHRSLPWVSMLPDLAARVVVRMHSYEAFTPMPLHTDWSGVDDLVFVSPHIRALVEASVPAVRGVRRHTIANRNLLDTYVRPKLPGAEHVLGLVGWNNVTKDPAWALDVLDELRRHDDRYRLRLLGHDFTAANLTEPARRYRDDLHARIDALGDAVERPGFTDDVPEALRGIGVILSTSRREGTHEGLVQGAASGSLPVVRNWPYVARWGGPASLYPDAWVVETPAEAAALVLEAAAAGRVGSPSADTAEWARTHYDWSVVRPRLDEVLLGPR